MIQITVIDAADQQTGTIINNQRVTLRFRWNLIANSWSFDLAVDDLPILNGRRIVIGADMFNGLGLDLGQLWAIDFRTGAYPGRVELPSGDVRLYHFSNEEFEAFQAAA